MGDSERAETGKRAVPAFLDLLAGAFVAVAVDRMLKEGFWAAVPAAAIGIALFMAGLNWQPISARFGRRFSDTATSVATDFRWWLAVILVVFFYVGFPAFKGVINGGVHKQQTMDAASVVEHAPQQPPDAKREAPAKSAKRIFVGFGPKYLMEMDEKNAAAESEAILKLYAGKWMKIENQKLVAAIRSNPAVSSYLDDKYVTFSIKMPGDYIVMCKIKDESQMETLMTMRPGTNLSFVGMITADQTMLHAILSLDPCELSSFG